jgi:hypothetical protein
MFVRFPPIPPPPSSSLPPQFSLNHTQKFGTVPLPSLEGCGCKFQPLNSPQKRGRTPAPPLSKGMWAAHSGSTEEFGEVETLGGTQDLGGPHGVS